MKEKVIYFSLNKARADSFYDYIIKKGICYQPKFSFSVVKPKEEFKDPRDLIPLIEEELKKDSLHIIIDYISCCEWDKFDNHATVIRDIIMAYPEVQFLFDETFVRNSEIKEKTDFIKEEESNILHKDNWCFLNFLFQDASIMTCEQQQDAGKGTCHKINIKVFIGNNEEEILPFYVLTDWHQFDLGNNSNGDFDPTSVKEQFVRLLKGRNNMYDGSNLRCAIKAYKFGKLHVMNNFRKLTDSRRDYVAVVVEEEYQQAMFNGYCLYANGFRVLPIMTATELQVANNSSKNFRGNYIVVRDYDLQFLDEDDKKTQNKQTGTFEIDYIRGAKNWSKIIPTQGFEFIPETGLGSNPYWGNFDTDKTAFISKGADNLDVRLTFENDEKRPMCPIENKSKLKLYGIKKPVEGIYSSIHRFEEIERRYKETLYDNPKDSEYVIDIKRQGDDGHSCPLDIYGIARSMVHRAEIYYYFKRHRLAALVAGEALELLNGFHNSLMKQAYYLQAVSENAMAMSLLGGEEDVLCDDLILRLKHKVKRDVNRLVRDKEDRRNLLMNIYNDCRLFCREKEYLNAADYALSIMMHEKEGFTFKKFLEFFDSSNCNGGKTTK